LGVVGAGGHEGVGGDVVQFRNLEVHEACSLVENKLLGHGGIFVDVLDSVPEVISGSLECRVLDKVPGDGQGVDSEGRDGTVVDRVLQPFFSIKSVASLVSPPGPCG